MNENTELVKIHGQNVKTDSLIVAEGFKKRHDDVIRKIENLKKNDNKGCLNFTATYYTVNNKKNLKYEMDRKSFSILAMRFTGKKALEWQIKFVNAFEVMEKIILRQQSAEWQHYRIEGKVDRHRLTDSIRDFVEYAKLMGSNNAARYYTTFTKMIYQNLFDIKSIPDNFRNTIDEHSLKRLMIAEDYLSDWIQEAMATCGDYHDVYKIVKTQLKRYVDITGNIYLGNCRQQLGMTTEAVEAQEVNS